MEWIIPVVWMIIGSGIGAFTVSLLAFIAVIIPRKKLKIRNEFAIDSAIYDLYDAKTPFELSGRYYEGRWHMSFIRNNMECCSYKPEPIADRINEFLKEYDENNRTNK